MRDGILHIVKKNACAKSTGESQGYGRDSLRLAGISRSGPCYSPVTFSTREARDSQITWDNSDARFQM